MNHSYTRLLIYSLLHILFCIFPIFTAAPNPAAPVAAAPDPHEFLRKKKAFFKNQEYFRWLNQQYPLHALIVQVSNDDDCGKLVELLNTGVSIREADQKKGNTPFHLLANCNTLSSSSQLNKIKEFLKIEGNEIWFLEFMKNQLIHQCTYKSQVLTLLCDELEKRAKEKAIALNTLLTLNCSAITGPDGTIISQAKNITCRQFFDGTQMQLADYSIFELPNEIITMILTHLNFDDLKALRLVDKTAYAAAMYATSRMVQKKYMLDILKIKNKAGKTALEIVKKADVDDALKQHNKNLTTLQYQPGFVPVPMEKDMKTIFNLFHLIEEEQFPLEQTVAAYLEQLEVKYASMPENITRNPKPAQEGLETPVPRTMLALAYQPFAATLGAMFSTRKKG